MDTGEYLLTRFGEDLAMAAGQFEFRHPRAGEIRSMVELYLSVWGALPTADEVDWYVARMVPSQMIVVHEDDQLIGVSGEIDFELTVPGNVIGVSGFSYAAVLPTHRRRGILRSMMISYLQQTHERAVPISVLTADHAGIFGRYGFGVASLSCWWRIRRSALTLRPSAFSTPEGGRVRIINADEARSIFPPVFDKYRRQQVGQFNRDDRWWEGRVPEASWRRSIGDALRFAVYVEGEDVLGTIRYRVHEYDEGTLARYGLTVEELVALTPEAERELFSFIGSIDQVDEIEIRSRPVDDLLRWQVANSRELRASHQYDWLWLRILDVPKALELRTYSNEGSLVIDVLDDTITACHGRFSLTTSTTGATCAPTTLAPDISLDIADLSSLYLGVVSPTQLLRARRILEHEPGAIQRADGLFRSSIQPFCSTDVMC